MFSLFCVFKVQEKAVKRSKITEIIKAVFRIKEIFKEMLNTTVDIDINAHFILDLEATSLDYLTLLVKIEEKYEIKFNQTNEPCYTILQFTNYIISEIK